MAKAVHERAVTDRFWVKVSRQSEGCWLWTAATFRSGLHYGMFRVSAQRLVQAHRFSWELEHGAIKDGDCVLHRCDVPQCVRPSHLFIGSQQDNLRDMMDKGRHDARRGESHPVARLDEAIVRAIRSRHVRPTVAAAAYGVSESTIRDVQACRTWKHVR